MEIALSEARDHVRIYTGLTGVLSKENAAKVQEWLGEAEAFESRQMADTEGRPIIKGKEAVKNPYESRSKSK